MRFGDVCEERDDIEGSLRHELSEVVWGFGYGIQKVSILHINSDPEMRKSNGEGSVASLIGRHAERDAVRDAERDDFRDLDRDAERDSERDDFRDLDRDTERDDFRDLDRDTERDERRDDDRDRAMDDERSKSDRELPRSH